MLTLFSIPKAFTGHVATIQRNALRSWQALDGCQVVLVGDEEGVRETAQAAGVDHIAGVAVSNEGTPRLDDAFRRVEEIASRPLRCLVNADIVLLDGLLPAVSAVHEGVSPFLVVGETIDIALDVELALGGRETRSDLAERARREGRSRGPTAIDYFVYTPGLFDPVPAFVVGRARFDNWLVWQARQRGRVVDVSKAVLAVHQRHDYAHVSGGLRTAHFGSEAARNLELAGGKRRLYTIHDASHRLGSDLRLRRNFGAMLRVRENIRKATWKLGRR